jgi:sugar O-acyltransferase (sialic acid O-acetyltransferase NeuD family)
MLVVGAGGFAKEILEILYQNNLTNNLCFFDNVNDLTTPFLYEKYRILKSFDEAKDFFRIEDNKFTLGIGNPFLRKKMADNFTEIGGEMISTISVEARIGHFGIEIQNGCNILSGSIISNDVFISKGTIIYFNSIITHDCFVDEFVEISPGAKLLGRCKIGKYTQIGTNATILPKVQIGTNVIVAAGAVVTKDVPDNCMVAGVPAIIKKQLNPLSF